MALLLPWFVLGPSGSSWFILCLWDVVVTVWPHRGTSTGVWCSFKNKVCSTRGKCLFGLPEVRVCCFNGVDFQMDIFYLEQSFILWAVRSQPPPKTHSYLNPSSLFLASWHVGSSPTRDLNPLPGGTRIAITRPLYHLLEFGWTCLSAQESWMRSFALPFSTGVPRMLHHQHWTIYDQCVPTLTQALLLPNDILPFSFLPWKSPTL